MRCAVGVVIAVSVACLAQTHASGLGVGVLAKLADAQERGAPSARTPGPAPDCSARAQAALLPQQHLLRCSQPCPRQGTAVMGILDMHMAMLSDDMVSLQRLRGGGLIKKKSKAKHALRKGKKRGLWWVDDKMLQPQDKATQQRDARILDAAKMGDIAALRAALEAGSDVNARVRQGPTPMLLSTPLHLAAYRGHRDVISELIASKCKVDAVNMGKKTALHVAARQGFPQICQMLLDAGANVHAEDADGYTPQDDAEMTGFQTGDARQVLQAAGALRHRAFSVLGNPGFGGQKARNSSASAAPGGGSKEGCNAQADMGPEGAGRAKFVSREEVREGYRNGMVQEWGAGAHMKRTAKPVRALASGVQPRSGRRRQQREEEGGGQAHAAALDEDQLVLQSLAAGKKEARHGGSSFEKSIWSDEDDEEQRGVAGGRQARKRTKKLHEEAGAAAEASRRDRDRHDSQMHSKLHREGVVANRVASGEGWGGGHRTEALPSRDRKGPRARKRERARQRGKGKFYTQEDGLKVAEKRLRQVSL